MQKNFDWWSKEKQIIDNSTKVLYPHIREIWSVKLWINIWFEQNGKTGCMRPVLIIKKIWKLYFVIPMTTKVKEYSSFYHAIKSISFGKPLFLILSQWKVIDVKRFVIKIGKVRSNRIFTNKKHPC
jgi:hypothetical protein